MLGIVIYHTNLKINNQDCIFLRTSQFPIAIYTVFVTFSPIAGTLVLIQNVVF